MGTTYTTTYSGGCGTTVTMVSLPCPNTYFTAPLVPHPTAATAGLIPGAERYYKPYVAPNEAMPSATSDNGPLSAWGDLLERMTRELSTDTMEIANLDNQVCVSATCPLPPPPRLRLLEMLRGSSMLPPLELWQASAQSRRRAKLSSLLPVVSSHPKLGLAADHDAVLRRSLSTTATTRCSWLSTRP